VVVALVAAGGEGVGAWKVSLGERSGVAGDPVGLVEGALGRGGALGWGGNRADLGGKCSPDWLVVVALVVSVVRVSALGRWEPSRVG
jgi:hypothetical protein